MQTPTAVTHIDPTMYHYNMIKGRIAEAIVEEMFVKSQLDIYRFGMENMVPGILRRLKKSKSNIVTNQVRKMPDFIVQTARTVLFVEVKYRRDGVIQYSKLQEEFEEFPYPECILIVVSKSKIYCTTIEQLKEIKELTPDPKYHILNFPDFSLDKDVVNYFEAIVLKAFDKMS